MIGKVRWVALVEGTTAFEGNVRQGGVCFDLSRELICFLSLLLYFSK